MPAIRVHIFAFLGDGSVETLTHNTWERAWNGERTLTHLSGEIVRFAMIYLSAKNEIIRLDTFRQKVMPGGWLRSEDAIDRGHSILLKYKNRQDMPEEHFWTPTDAEMAEIANRLPKGLRTARRGHTRTRDQGGYQRTRWVKS